METKIKNKAKTYRLKILGIVQGVGFRPFIHRLATSCGFYGNVSNTAEGVIVYINADQKKDIGKFIEQIKIKKPTPALIEKIEVIQTDFKKFNNFNICKSKEAGDSFQLISPDLATCNDCLADIKNKSDKRRHNYAFTNCTNCGPRFTIIKKLPYDRLETTMKNFKMCSQCALEFGDKYDRRFHAQPIACSVCGPTVWLADRQGNTIESKDPIKAAAEKIREGFIVALKGLGGFQLACDATNAKAVKNMRAKKGRPFKPFAVMVKHLNQLEKYYHLDKLERSILASPRAPIVLLSKKNSSFVASEVSYYNKMEGVMLPYTPLHHLIFEYLDFPLIMTSGNRSEEPIAKDNCQALKNLGAVCDFFLMHNRDIYSRYDDSLVKVFNGKEMILRRARGYSPYPVKIKQDIRDSTLLGLGAQEKNTFCLLKKNYAIISQHLGDLDDADSIDFFKETLDMYKKLFNIHDIDILAHDSHPQYSSTKLAYGFKDTIKRPYQHHQSHIASVIAENGITEDILGFAWDGTGYGDDGKIWGSEIFTYRQKKFSRIGHLTEKIMPGGEITIKKPYRMAISYLYYLYLNSKAQKKFTEFVFDNCKHFEKLVTSQEIETIAAQIESKFNSPSTTSMGRLFDAVSSTVGLTHIASYEGEAAIHLESEAHSMCSDCYEPVIDGFIINDLEIFRQILQDVRSGVDAKTISSKFHNCLASAILVISKRARKEFNITSIALSGGVFQNHMLLNKAFNLLENNNFKAYTNFKVPVNDGGISLGQAYLAALEIERRNKCV